MKIIQIENSNRKNKRFKVTLDDGQNFHFGLLGANTYLEHHDNRKRDNYRKRHLGNDTERYLIENLIPSAALFSYWIIWGDSTDLIRNIEKLNELFADRQLEYLRRRRKMK
jgi:hypothetical protein